MLKFKKLRLTLIDERGFNGAWWDLKKLLRIKISSFIFSSYSFFLSNQKTFIQYSQRSSGRIVYDLLFLYRFRTDRVGYKFEQVRTTFELVIPLQSTNLFLAYRLRSLNLDTSKGQ